MTATHASPSVNAPEIWQHCFPWPEWEANKYDRGHAIVLGGPSHSAGAAKLAAYAALRIGSGLVSVACDAESLPIYAASFRAVMTKLVETSADFSSLINDIKANAILIGPGAGVTEATKAAVMEALISRKALVLDADALTAFSKTPERLFERTHASCILTPHEGEFTRLFGSHVNPDEARLERALHAARVSGSVVILKGAETIIAAPNGKAVINLNAPAFLATAGSGDVLAGICTGLLAQGMPSFDSACAAVWLHGEAAQHFGPGLIAEDIADRLPPILQKLHEAQL